MKEILIIVFILISINVFCQNKTELKLVFLDECTKKIIQPDFEIDSIKGLGSHVINVFVERNEDICVFNTILKTKSDTIRIPRVLFSTGVELHSNRWAYLKCKFLCEGKVVDYYRNENKRLEGVFVKGKPKYLKEYNKNGKIEVKYFFNYPKLSYKRINYYDENEEVEDYELYDVRKRKTIIRYYNRDGELIKKEINRI